MASWSCFPPEIKQHVVKRLDFMSRHSLRHTSRLDRQVVDSTKCQVPRVRFGYKEGRGLIVVYTGIDQFLRLEFEKSKNGVFLTKFENNYQCSSNPCLVTGGGLTQLSVLSVMSKMFFFLTQNVRIQVLEYEIPQVPSSKVSEVGATTVSIMTDSFKIDKIVFSSIFDHEIAFDIETKAALPCQTFQFYPDRPDPVPLIACDRMTDFEDIKVQMIHTLYTSEKMEDTSRYEEKNRQNLASEFKKFPDSVMSTLRNVNNRNKPKNVRSQNGDIVQWTKATKCGFSIRTVRETHEEKFKEELKSTECGIGDLCPRCTDSFDYWYTQNLPRRLYFEPFWDNFLLRPPNSGDVYELKMRKLKLNIEREEKRRQRIREVMGKKKKLEKSWGFGKEDTELEEMAMMSDVFGNKMGPIEKISKKIEKWLCSIEVKSLGPDTVEMEKLEPLVEETTVISFKYLTYFFFIPILISIAFYFFFY